MASTMASNISIPQVNNQTALAGPALLPQLTPACLQSLRAWAGQLVPGYRPRQSYEDFFREKINASLASLEAGQGRSNEEVEAAFAARRAKIAV